VFSERMNTEVVQQFWEALQQGVFITEAAEKVGTYRKMGARWLAATGGIRPRRGRDLICVGALHVDQRGRLVVRVS
jgi:transposase, IS30 family